MATAETRRMVLAAAAACEEKKAEETRILELDPSDSAFTDFFLIASGANVRQTQAIADEVELRLKRDFGARPNSVEGRRLGEWVLMDYIDFVVHIFLAERRAYYDIERLRSSARPLDRDELTAMLLEKTQTARKKPEKKAAGAGRAKRVGGKKNAVKISRTKKAAEKKQAEKPAAKAAKKRSGAAAKKSS